MASERPAAPRSPVDEVAERAARVRAMLERWAVESVTGEPEWSVEDIERLRLARDEPHSTGK